ncbi:unnamed protein product [Vitrella brassicaformis CCMP3155]|uniref:Uncharacterized protein n=1 Tax=Vitrella brassicaformis (strain CCMP3155) TaxID=1169540 RepID=A0A0G4GLK3_VITBC|nr:unnamed protein product [Vitrella brassicaformis CCMP3155]|mmetsp:Transcript_19293/g.46609  ORF Transcript_19293/g.46609 Transcript_19293/m.46609 type:complete len:269 (-) Transcript_19293:249-1055(-)|eukprot:CEM30997.1 unnamed protein product [Vitrella brassicaformis CCMP3155]
MSAPDTKSEPSGQLSTAQGDTLPEPDLKIILLGDSAVGKSKLVERFLLQNYNPRQLSTYALTLFRHYETIDGKRYSVDFWDTAGQEQFDHLHPSYYYRADACILAFDCTRKGTYKSLDKWYRELREYRPDIPCILVANKIDVDESVTRKRFQFATNNSLPFYFVSASNGTNVVRVFREAIQLAVHHQLHPKDEVTSEILRLLRSDDHTAAPNAPPFDPPLSPSPSHPSSRQSPHQPPPEGGLMGQGHPRGLVSVSESSRAGQQWRENG